MFKDRNFIKNIKWLAAGNIIQMGLSAAYLLLLAIFLSVNDFGFYSVIVGVAGLVSMLTEVRLQDVASKHFWPLSEELESNQKQSLSKDIVSLYTFDLLVKLILPCAIPVVIFFYSKYSELTVSSYLPLYIFFISFYFMKVGSQLNFAILRIFERPELIVGSMVLELVVRLSLISIIYSIGYLSLEAVIIVFCVTGIWLNMVQFQWVYRLLKKNEFYLKYTGITDLKISIKKFKKLMILNNGVSLTALMNNDLDVSILPFVVSLEKIALYKMAKNVAGLAWKLADPISLVFLPKASMLMDRQEYRSLKELTIKVMLISFSVVLIANVGLSVVLFVGGSKIESLGYPGLVPVFSVMAIAITICSPLAIGHSLLIAQDKAELTVYAAAVSTISGTICLIFLTKSLGLIGAAIAWGSSLAVVILVPGIYAYRLLGTRYNASEQHRLS